MLVDAPHGLVEARPGETVLYRFRVRNDGNGAANLSVRVHGLGVPNTPTPISGGAVAAGRTIDVEMPLVIPEDFGAGEHAVGIEVRSDRNGEPAVLTDLTVSIGSLDKVVLRVLPSVIRGKRKVRFSVEAINRRTERTDMQLSASGPDLEVRLEPRRVVLEP